MSSIYVLEPPTKGKVVLSTSVGAIDIELWPKEAPKAVRNFVQLCLDGYYDGTIFHRIIKDFMAQGGDKTGKGTGGVSIYGDLFIDEIHSRLRFNHRGLVACANSGQPNCNNSQFFITLDRTEWLDKKNTIFGKVTGDTIYNAMKLGEVEVDKNDRPLDPPVIYSVEVLWNPFDDMVSRRQVEQNKEDAKKLDLDAKPKKKEKKQLNLLSFGEEAEEEDVELSAINMKIKSSHDVLEDPRLLKAEAAEDEKEEASEKQRKADLKGSVRLALTAGKKEKSNERQEGVPSSSRRSEEVSGSDEDSGGDDFDSKMRRQVLDKRRQLGGSGTPGKDKVDKKAGIQKVSENDLGKQKNSLPGLKEADDDDDDEDEEEEEEEDEKGGGGGKSGRRREKLKINRKGMGSEARTAMKESMNLDAALLTPLEQQREKYKQKKRALGDREKNTLDMLANFQKKLRESKTKETKKAEDEDEEDGKGVGWLHHRLKFSIDPNKKDDMAKNEDPSQYVVHDPLLEKGKEKFNKQQAKFKKRNKEWAGRSID